MNRTRLQSSAICILYQATHITIQCAPPYIYTHSLSLPPPLHMYYKRTRNIKPHLNPYPKLWSCTVRQPVVLTLDHKTSDCYSQNVIATLSCLLVPICVLISFDATSTLLLVFDLLLNVPISCLGAIEVTAN